MPALIIPKTAVIVSSIVFIPDTTAAGAKKNRVAQSKGFWSRVRLRSSLMISGNTSPQEHRPAGSPTAASDWPEAAIPRRFESRYAGCVAGS